MKSKNTLAKKHDKENMDDGKPCWKLEVDLLLNAVPSLNEYFVIRNKIGEGTFSSVYLAGVVSCPDKFVAIKHIIPTSHPNRIAMELDCLQQFGGKANVMEILSCMRRGSHFIIVMPFFRNNRFTDFFDKMDLNEIREYLRSLLEALKSIHADGIIHRDVKPSNFLYNRKQRRYALIDFGLAQHVNLHPCSTQKRSLNESTQICGNSQSTMKRTKICSLERTIGSGLSISSSWLLGNSGKLIGNSNNNNLGNSIHEPNGENQMSATKAFVRLMPSTQGISSQLTVRSSSSADLHLRSLSRASSLHNKSRLYEASSCDCFGRGKVCKTCLGKPQQNAARAGTAGYRPPEVLLKHPKQTTALDMWAVGIMFLNMLSGRYPLFDARDDLSALAEMISLFGTESVRQFATKIGKTLTCCPEQPSRDLGDVCDKFRREHSDDPINRSLAYDLLRKLLAIDPNDRISATDALQHPFITK